jgi:hypothetical protein
MNSDSETKKLKQKLAHLNKELTNLINDPQVPLLIGFWITEIMDGKAHKS